jgi:PII-like signaling protein
MHGFKGERVLMRIHINEQDRDPTSGKPLYEGIIALLRDRHYAGATVLRGAMGFGGHAILHTDHVEIMSFNLPLVIECVETSERVEAILPVLDNLISGGLITLERAKVIMYRPHLPDHERSDWPVDITGSWERIESDTD